MFPSHQPAPPGGAEHSILRWGIIGLGWIAERFVHSLKTYSRQQVVAVASRSREGRPGGRGMGIPCLRPWRRCWRVRILMRCIATPHNHHFPDGMQALKAGKHVLIEKPFALNLGEGRELQAEAARRGSWRWRQCGAITRRNMM